MLQKIVQAQDQYISELEGKNAKLEEMVKRADSAAPRSPVCFSSIRRKISVSFASLRSVGTLFLCRSSNHLQICLSSLSEYLLVVVWCVDTMMLLFRLLILSVDDGART
jgi:hypothetical protein